ncbi:ATP-dependent DNA helicase srs2 [Conoideocrella luteorostrata]|uniref:DNA 3'-5' helicase n=1 Tax=Conoideocrella luteorostrata TaxID=1105319 RepID=A0AAJ0CFK2_9HYPO|nr:ATP-dependent DNA helicase srs2 [Conoideocrella luteorostrata]
MAAQNTDPILQSLNRAQRHAVTSNAHTVAILAGPGSGKTHTLTSRVVWLIQQVGYQPADIIVATFTVKAAREMRERIGKRLGEDSQKKIVLGTFHSLARRYLAAYGKRIGLDPKFGIADDGDSRAIIQRIVKRLDLQIEPSYAKAWISKKKSKGTAPVPKQDGKRQEHPSLGVCFKEYQEHLARANLLDYDDLLVRCVELLQEYPTCVSNVQTVLIDEYQDTNGIQYDLMKLFAQARQRITIVGDPDQSIYGWRSAEIKNLYRLLRDYPETDEISMEENYRSSQLILDVSLQVIQQDTKRYKKVLLPVHSRGTKPVLRKLRSSSAEGEWVVSELRRAMTMFGGALKNEDVAILLRSASLSRHIESALGKAGISYRMVGGHKFYERKEIKILLDYLRVIYQPDNNDAIARIINVPRRGIGEATIKALLEEAEQSKLSLWGLLWRHCRGGRQATTKIRPIMEQKLNTELLRIISTLRQQAAQIHEMGALTLVDLIEQLVNLLDFKTYLVTEYQEDHEQRWSNVQELLNLAGDFMRDFGKADEEVLPEIEDVEQVREDEILGRFLANVALASDAQSDDKQQDKTSQVTISTIHAAKGLEWPVVFVPSVYEGSIPHSRSEDMDEERRLLYVAMTRAKALLYLSCPMYGSQGLGNKVELSPFLSSFAAAFDQKGPSFDRPVVESVAKILDRVVPTEKSIFDKMPPMFCPQDDQFPIDPFDPKDADPPNPGADTHYTRAPKRQKTQNAAHSCAATDDRPWKPDYATTMQQSAGFTIPSLPGFVTAGAHQSALAVSGIEAASSLHVEKTMPKRGAGGVTTNRRPDQRSLLGFVTTEPKAPITTMGSRPAPVDYSLKRYQAAASRAAQRAPLQPTLTSDVKPAIDPEFARHKILGPQAAKRPSVHKTTDHGGAAKDYACFSSSPPRQTSPEPKKDEQPLKNPELQRPAASFHSTTFTAMKPIGGVRRPVGLGPAPSMDRLRKPFKPLTINRPQGQPKK